MENIEKILAEALKKFPYAVYILDDKQNIIWANDSMCRMMNEPRSLITGTNIHELVDIGVTDQCVTDRVYKTKKEMSNLNDIRSRGGRCFRQLLTSKPMLDPDGNIRFVISVVDSLNLMDQRFRQAIENAGTLPLPDEKTAARDQNIICESYEMKQVLASAMVLSRVDSSVAIYGESGTGKEIVAKYIHNSSSRGSREMIVLNCAAFPESLLESELFGYAPGAFTGALREGKQGLIESANKSTLFLDEINSLPLSLQGKLLRALETRQIRRIGETKSRDVDFRLISASNVDLEKCVAEGTFRADLYYRISVVPLRVPPLRERVRDILPMAEYYLDIFGKRHGLVKHFSANAESAMLGYRWPGNVRELRNFVENMLVLSKGSEIDVTDLPAHMTGGIKRREPAPGTAQGSVSAIDLDDPDFSLKDYLDQCEKAVLTEALKRTGSTRKAAKLLKVDQSSVVRKKEKYKIDYDVNGR